ncbi:hypothetical protein ACHAWC_011018 [Mediolabrus comicus]
MGSVISSSAAAAAESLSATDGPPQTTSTSGDDTAAAATAAAAASANRQSQHIVDRLIDSGSTSPLRRRTPRKSHSTDFYSPCERVNHESERTKQNFQDELDEKWEGRRQELIQYKNVHDTFFVSTKDDMKLSRWADNQRQFHRLGKMSEQRVQLLQAIGFFDEQSQKRMKSPTKSTPTKSTPTKTTKDEKKKGIDEAWEENRQMLIAYKDEHDTFFVSPQRNMKLSRWAENQRQAHRRGEMKENRLQLLREIKFFDEQYQKSPQKSSPKTKSGVGKTVDEMWEENRQALITYKDDNGNLFVPSKSKLGRWIENQRRAYKLGKMSQKRIKLLQEIHFFDDDQQQPVEKRRTEALREATFGKWEEKRQELLKYKLKNGNFDVPSKSQLGRWIENQKRAYRLDNLSNKRVELLQQMGLLMEWDNSPKRKRKFSSTENEGAAASPSRRRKRRSSARSTEEDGDTDSEEENKVGISMGSHFDALQGLRGEHNVGGSRPPGLV